MDQNQQLRVTAAAGMAGELPDHVTQDAVVIVPGIMGSELFDTHTNKHLWGLEGISWLRKAWTSPKGLEGLRMTDEELDGKHTRIKATGLLKHSAWTPYLAGSEPYTDLVETVATSVAHPPPSWNSHTTGACPSRSTPVSWQRRHAST
ncbi:hypothetical protein ACIPY6_40165 [Streptomyces sp. NPDC090054]|uniref:hypothetical protein n=1 Tax=Streptomyces sp. NPDC090054 TaxID=3365933 RepID=UPI00382A1729